MSTREPLLFRADALEAAQRLLSEEAEESPGAARKCCASPINRPDVAPPARPSARPAKRSFEAAERTPT